MVDVLLSNGYSMIEKFAGLIPESIWSRSGAVFYSGRAAFSRPSKVYILGLNPGGSPLAKADQTVERHTERVLKHEQSEWSAYCDEAWGGCPPGKHRLQSRVHYVFDLLGMDLRLIPASNVVFVRSKRESTLDGSFPALAEECWPFHKSVIEDLKVQTILCFGQTAGHWIADRVGARRELAVRVEENQRRWRSVAVTNDHGLVVVVATHPGIANWMAPASDPTPLISDAMSHVRESVGCPRFRLPVVNGEITSPPEPPDRR